MASQGSLQQGNPASVSMLVAAARDLGPFLATATAMTEDLGRVPLETMDEIRKAGLNRISQPEAFGGHGLGPSAVFKVCFELARSCPSTSWCTMVANSVAWFAAYWPDEVQGAIWASDIDTMAAMSGIPSGKGRKVDGGYEIWGKWPWASNCDNCDWAIVSCAIADVEGKPPETQWFLVSMSDLEVLQDSWDMAGMQGSGSKTLSRIEPLHVPDARHVRLSQVMEGETPGHLSSANLLARYNFATLSGVVLLGPVLGMAQGALDSFLDYMSSKVRTSLKAGAGVAASTNVATQMRVADASARIDAATALVLQAAEQLEAKVIAGEEIGIDERMRMRRNIGFAARQAMEALNLLVEGAGSSSFSAGAPFQRYWRDMTVGARHVTLDTDGIYQMYGAHLFGLPAEGSY